MLKLSTKVAGCANRNPTELKKLIRLMRCGCSTASWFSSLRLRVPWGGLSHSRTRRVCLKTGCIKFHWSIIISPLDSPQIWNLPIHPPFSDKPNGMAHNPAWSRSKGFASRLPTCTQLITSFPSKGASSGVYTQIYTRLYIHPTFKPFQIYPIYPWLFSRVLLAFPWPQSSLG